VTEYERIINLTYSPTFRTCITYNRLQLGSMETKKLKFCSSKLQTAKQYYCCSNVQNIFIPRILLFTYNQEQGAKQNGFHANIQVHWD